MFSFIATTTNPMAVLRNIQNGCLYRFLGNDLYENLKTKQRGKISPDIAKEIFVVNLELGEMIKGNPNIEYLIETLKLKYIKNE